MPVLSRNLETVETFVNLSTCKHFGILEELCSVSVPKMELGHLVCYRCHAKLKTIHDFKLQAEESFTLLWNRQNSAIKRDPTLKVVIVNEELLTPIKSEENIAIVYPEVVSGCWMSEPHSAPVNEASDQEMSVPQPITKTENEEEEELGNENCGSRFSEISSKVTNYHIEVSGLHPDSPQDNGDLSDLDTDDVPLVKMTSKPQTHEQEDTGDRLADTDTTFTDVAEDTQNPLYCTPCNKYFKTKRTLRQHNITVHHQPIPRRPVRIDIYAGIIKEITLTHQELMSERERELKSGSYLQRLHRCNLCIISFNHKKMLMEHIKKHQMDGKSFKCGICQCVYDAGWKMKAHEKRHYRRYDCVLCQKRFNILRTAIDHYNNLHEEKSKVTYSCDQCNFTAVTRPSYSYHIQKHRGLHVCPICRRTFATKTSLKQHTNYVHEKINEMVQCKECNKMITSKKNLAAHNKAKHPSLSATTEKGCHYCDTCNRFFVSAGVLKRHFKTHRNHSRDEDKRFVCDICNKRFFTKSLITYHMIRLHLKGSEFSCSQCGKSFPSGCWLKMHVSYVHDKVRPPRDKICDYCGKGFTSAQLLRSHIRRHTGERPYQCAQCASTFTQSASLHTHIKLVHTKSRGKKC